MCVAGEKVLMFFFSPKNSEMRLGRWCVGSSHFYGIGIYPVSDTAGICIFRSVLLYYKIWREHIFKFSRELFFENSVGIPFFLQKEGEVYKEGADAPPS